MHAIHPSDVPEFEIDGREAAPPPKPHTAGMAPASAYGQKAKTILYPGRAFKIADERMPHVLRAPDPPSLLYLA